MSTTRRQFLQSTLGTGALVSLTPSLPTFLLDTSRQAAQNDSHARTENILVIVQLTGGNDGLNTVVPYNDDGYHRNRKLLNVAGNVIKVDDRIGLHPVMRGMADLLQDGALSIVQGVGYPNPNRSHFASMNIWHTAQHDRDTSGAGREIGWIGRTLDWQSQEGVDVPALHLGTGEQPLALRGETPCCVSARTIDDFRLKTTSGFSRDVIHRVTQSPRPDHELLQYLHRTTLSALQSSQRVQDALRNEKTPVQYPGFQLAQHLKTVAQLIDAGLGTRIYYLSLDGFDTHSQQLAAHAGLLGQLSNAVATFFADLRNRAQADRVMVMTFSEFGRRVKENASAGTDHGVAAPMFLMGPKVQAGPFAEHPSLGDLMDGDLKHHTDFRRVYATVLEKWLKMESAPVLGGDYDPLPVLNRT